MISGTYLLTALRLNIKLYDHIIEADDGPYKSSTAPKVDLGTYEFKDINTAKLSLNNRL